MKKIVLLPIMMGLSLSLQAEKKIDVITLENYYCFDILSSEGERKKFEDSQLKVKATRLNGKYQPMGSIEVFGQESLAQFYIDGIDKRWDWQEADFSLVIDMGNVGRYYDFSGDKEEVEPSKSFRCEVTSEILDYEIEETKKTKV